jgi:hypothetical protein
MTPALAVWSAVIPGDAVWAALAVAAGTWLVASWRTPSVVGPDGVARWLVGSWAGRLIALAAWAGAGWHLFCQRP